MTDQDKRVLLSIPFAREGGITQEALVKQRERFKLALDVRQKKIADGVSGTDDERAKV